MSERDDAPTPLGILVSTVEEFDRVTREALPELLDRATAQTRRFLRETGQWMDDVGHEKLALRWGYEMVERFLICGRAEVPCRPFFLLDSLIAKYFSEPTPLCHHRHLATPLGRYLDGLTARAVISRDALIALFHHVYGYGQGQVVRLLGLGPIESQRIYKNFARWREMGWERTVLDMGLTEEELRGIETQRHRSPQQFQAEVIRLLDLIQAHYRRSEPQHFPCLSRQQWMELYEQEYGYDYRVWHLALCRICVHEVCVLRRLRHNQTDVKTVNVQVRPAPKSGLITLVPGDSGGNHGSKAGRPTQRLSRPSA
jgi:hypothetical protein